jgi:F0F1-type ATP synthase assembly protein I
VQTPSVENIFARSWELLTRNGVIIVPGVVVGLVVGLLTGWYGATQPETYGQPSDTAAALTSGLAGFVTDLIPAVIVIAGYIVTQCYTAGMAGAAWQHGTTTLADGTRAVHDDAGNVLVAGIGLLLCGVVALLVAQYTLLLSIFAFYLFTLYTIAAAVVGNRRGFDALRESFAIAWARFGTTLIVGVLLGVLQLFGRVIAHIFGQTPLLGPVVAAIVMQIVVAYAMLVVVGEYLALRGSVTPPVASPPDV